MNDIGIVEVVYGLCNLVDNILFVFFLEDVALPNKRMEINIHVFEHEVDIFVIVGPEYFFETNDVGVLELLEKHDLSVDSLGVG